MLRKIKRFLRSNKITKTPYAFLGRVKNRYAFSKMRKEVQKNGVKTIHYIQSVLEQTGVPFFFDMGTLLGIVREGRLLGHDRDVDVAVCSADPNDIDFVTKILMDNGCLHKYRYEVADIGVVEDSFVINGIKFDINYYYRNGTFDLCYLSYTRPEKTYEPYTVDVVELRCQHVERLKSICFGGKMIAIPEDAEFYLQQRYGTNWRIPNKNYFFWEGPSASPIPNMGRIVDYFDTRG